MDTGFGRHSIHVHRPRYTVYGAPRALPVPPGELGDGQVLQDEVDSVIVTVHKRRIRCPFGFMSADSRGQTYS